MPMVRFTVRAVDAAAEMLKLAAINIAAAGLADRITPELVDAKQLPHAAARFAAVVSNSIIHHIPDPAPAFAEMVRVCAPGGALFVRDLLRPASMSALRHLVDLHAAGATDEQRRLFAASLNAAFNGEEVRNLVGRLGFAPDTVAQTSDRHWTWLARKPA